MRDCDCVQFLQDLLPSLGYRWRGFKKVRRQVCKRLARHCAALGIQDLDAYRAYLRAHAEEQAVLDTFCRISISRFCRDIWMYQALEEEVLPSLANAARARGARTLTSWSAGCASGEEPYSLIIVWRQALAARFTDLEFFVTATDIDGGLLARAGAGRYQAGSLRDLADVWRAAAFVADADGFVIRDAYRAGVTFLQQDIRSEAPPGRFDLVLCRNLAFTYFDDALQRRVLERLVASLRPGAALVVGGHESLPSDATGLIPWASLRSVYRRL